MQVFGDAAADCGHSLPGASCRGRGWLGAQVSQGLDGFGGEVIEDSRGGVEDGASRRLAQDGLDDPGAGLAVEDLHSDGGLGRVRVRTVTAGPVQAAVVAVLVGVLVHQIAFAQREATVVTASSAVHWTSTQCSLPWPP